MLTRKGESMARQLSDRKLKVRVRSILEQEVSHPAAVVVDVEGGQVTLGGAVLAAELADLLAAVEAVNGVQGILNHLEVHESAEDVPELRKRQLLKGRNLAPAARVAAGIALSGVGLGLLATSGISALRRRRTKSLADLPQPLRDEDLVPALGTEEGTFQPETL
jgi:hypothetical protein